MRIGIDSRALSGPDCGIKQYLSSLLVNLLEIDTVNQYFLYSCRSFSGDEFNKYDNVKTIVQPFNNGTLWVQLVLPWLLRRDNIAIFHSLEAMLPLISPCPDVVTFNDLVSFRLPQGHNKKAHLASILFPLVARRAKRIITISDNTANDVVKYLNIERAKIKTIYLAADVSSLMVDISDGMIENFKRRFNIKNKYILNVGVISPRKNIVRLIKAYAKLLKTGKINCDLILAGPGGWDVKEVEAVIKVENMIERVRLVGDVSRADLAIFYRLAELLVYPSLYEGFGLPVLEAMACGLPVVTSNISSLPEVAGDAARYVDPYDINDLAAAISELLKDDKLRALYRDKGFKRASKFSWKKCAEETLSVYHEVVKEK